MNEEKKVVIQIFCRRRNGRIKVSFPPSAAVQRFIAVLEQDFNKIYVNKFVYFDFIFLFGVPCFPHKTLLEI